MIPKSGNRFSDKIMLKTKVFHSGRINRKPGDQPLDLIAYRSLDLSIFLGTLLRQHVEHLRDQFSDLSKLGNAKAPRSARRRAEPHARSYGGLFGVEREA